MSTACTFVLFGATGDLARRMLFPSLYFLHAEGFLADGQRIVGASRSARETADFRAQVREWVEARAGERFDADVFEAFAERITYVPMDANETKDFETLREQAILTRARLRTVGTYLVGRGVSANRLVLRSFGGSRPIADNATEAGRERNNRIEVLESVRR